ncbi:MAG: hypothetical protein EBS05_17950 [Proteobacteria bacterium]|nr:hypothetical protein [Pseudomonadota bacterium]
MFHRIHLAVLLALTLAGNTSAQTKVPKAQFQGDYFGEMGRSFCVVIEVDTKARALVVKRDRDGERVRVPIKDDTELHFRDSWGELSDYFPGQHVMLFMYVDEDKNWTYPRAIQDDLHVSARHGWFATVTKIDRANGTYSTHREEKNKEGKITRSEDKEYHFTPTAKVWKGATPTSIDGLQVGDEVIQQQVEQAGKLVAVEIVDRKGDDAIRAAQDARHKQEEERLGLPAYVTDVEVLSGSLTATVAWNSAARARELKPGDVVTVTPTDGSKPFGAAVAATQPVDSRQRLQLVINARVAGRLSVGQSLRVFLPGTGPAVPTGRSGVPEAR